MLYLLSLAPLIMPSTVKRGALSPFVAAVSYLGLLQNYAVFAPNPATKDLTFRAVVTFADGKSEIQESPDFGSLSQFERALNHRARKLYLERLCNSDYRFLLMPYCRKLFAEYKGRHPVQVSLFRVARPIAPLAGSVTAAQTGSDTGPETSELCTYLEGEH